jgi:RNA polymerase sigma factor (sigma-70 family)
MHPVSRLPAVSPPVSAAVRGPVSGCRHGRSMHTADASCTSPLSRRLNADWSRLVTDRRVARRLARQPIAGHRELGTLLAAAGADRSVPEAAADVVLAEVIRVAATDELAARVVLQRVLPGLVRAAVRRTLHRPERRQELFEELTTSAWLVIRTYPLDRRPAKIAVNVLRDAEYQLCVRPARLRSASEVATPRLDELDPRSAALDGRLHHLEEPPAEQHVAEILQEAHQAGFPPEELQLLREVYVEGRPLAEVAARHGCTVRTIYNRREAAMRRLGALSLAA